jgi:hypothetical protein
MLTTEVVRRTMVGKCRFCGARLWYNIQEDRLEKKGGDPDCPCYFDDHKGEEDKNGSS